MEDGKLPDGKTYDNSYKGSGILMEECDRWSTLRVSSSPTHVFDLQKVRVYARWAELTYLQIILN